MRRKWLLISLIASMAVTLYVPTISAGLPSDRTIDWSSAGVPGGIPSRNRICATLGPSQAGQIQSTLNSGACSNPSDPGVVKLLPGTYSIGTLFMPSYVTLRGSGPGASGTTINMTMGGPAGIDFRDPLVYYNTIDPPPSTRIRNWTNGFNKGADTITLESTSGLEIGQIIALDQTDDGSLVTTNGSAEGCSACGRQGPDDRRLVQFVTVESLGTGNTVKIKPPLYIAFDSTRSPQAWWWLRSQQREWSGIEDLTLNNTGNSANSVAMGPVYACWVKNVQFFNGGYSHVRVSYGSNVTIRDCTFKNSQSYASASYGIAMGWNTSGLRVENNAFDHLASALDIPTVSGSYVGYNYVFNMYWTSYPVNLPECIMGHGAHTYMNLFEGNITPNFIFDFIHGSGSHNVMFRNRIIAWQQGREAGNVRPIFLDEKNKYYSAIGNVLGKRAFHTNYGNIFDVDSDSLPSFFREGNWDVVHNCMWSDASNRCMTPTEITALNMPDSLFYGATKPAFFGSGSEVPWPPIEPSAAVLANSDDQFTIPAKYCYDGGNMPDCLSPGGSENPPTPSPISIVAQPSNQAVIEGNPATFSISATGYPMPSYKWQKSTNGGSTWTDISGATGSGYSTPATVLADSGTQYRCIVSNNPGTGMVTVTSNAASLTVNPVPPAKFKIGDRVKIVNVIPPDVANIWSSASGGTKVGTQALGSLGTITAGPTENVNGIWWSVNFDSGADGWDTEYYLELAASIPPTANHPGDADQDMHMTMNEVTQYGFCWKSVPSVPTGCPTGANLNNATRAGLLYRSTTDGIYHFDSTKTPSACWVPGP